MELLGEVLPLVLYFLGCVLLCVLIMLAVRLINTVDKTNALLDDVQAKSKSLDGVFEAIESVGDTISSVNFQIVSGITGFLSRFFSKKKKKTKVKENDDYE